MKATKVLSLLALGLLVTSCGGNSNTSSTSSSSSSSSSSISTSSSTSSVISSSSSSSSLTTSTSSSSSSVTGPSLKEFILSSVAKLKEGNFSLTYEINNVNFTDVITKNYFYTAYLNTGSMLLETYSTTKYAYNFEITSENKVNVKGQTFNDELTGQELTSLDYVNKFKDFDTTREIEFSGDNNEIYTTDEVLVEAFASQLDFTGIKRLRFYTAADELVVELQGFDSSKNDYYTPETGAIVFIENIGTSKLDAIEDYLNSYVVPTETLDNKADNLFGNVSFTSAIYDNIFLDEYTSIERQGFSNLDIYDDYFRITDINEDNVSTSYTYEKIDEDGTLIITGVNGKNEVEEERTTTVVDDFNFVNKDGFELSKFRKFEGDEYYTYLGSNASDLAYSITQHKKFLEWPVESIKVKVEDGKVTQLIFSTGIMMDRLTGYYFYRYADSRVAATPNVITGAEKKVASENDAQIKSYLSYLNQEDSVFTSIEKDSAWEKSRFTKIVKGSDFYLKGTYLVDSDDGTSNNMESLGKDYYSKNGKIYSFTYDEKNNITLDKNPVSKTFKDIANYSIASEILNLKDGKLTTTGDIINIGRSIGDIYNPLTVDPSSLEMTVTDDKISSMNFAYVGGTEEVTFDYSPVELNGTMRANLDKAIAALDSGSGDRLTWEEDANTYDELVKAYGEEIAKKIPYLNDEDFNRDHYFADFYLCDWEDKPYFIIATDTYSEDYSQKYKAYLLTLGYTTEDNITFVNETDKLRIDVVDDDGSYEFIHIYVLD